MSKKFICPACGSKKATRFEKKGFDHLTLGNEFSFNDIYYKCDSCGEEGDFFAETDENFLNAQKKAQAILVKQILENLNEAGIAMAMFERVFELPTRTLTRWKTGDFSSSAIALLRIVTTYPWILQVAEHRFESNFASHAVITAAVKEFSQEVKKTLSMNSKVLELKSGSTISATTSVNFYTQPKLENASKKSHMVGG